MPDQVVKTTVRLWSTEVAMADAADAADTGQQGVVALSAKAPYPDAYVFSNNRRFREGPKPDGGG